MSEFHIILERPHGGRLIAPMREVIRIMESTKDDQYKIGVILMSHSKDATRADEYCGWSYRIISEEDLAEEINNASDE